MRTDRVSIIRKVVARSLGMVAAAGVMLSLMPAAHALSLSNPGMAPVAKQARDAITTQVRGHGGRGGGGGFHGGGFRGGGHAFHGGGFRGGGFRAAPAFRGGGFHHRPAFVGGGFRHGGPVLVRRGFHAPVYYGHRHRHFGPRYYGYVGPRYYSYGPRYYAPRRFCRVVMTYYGPRKICRYRPWHHRHWHHRRHFNVYW